MAHRARGPLLAVSILVGSAQLARRLGRRSTLVFVGLRPRSGPPAILATAIGGGVRTRTRSGSATRLLGHVWSDTVREALALRVLWARELASAW
eukprot:12259231-Alexandrium_andersonii.AAC.1